MPGFPRIEFRYGGIFDLIISKMTQFEMKPDWPAELEARMPAWQAAWDDTGAKLLEQAVATVGKSFRHKDMFAELFVCPRFPSMSHPLVVNVVPYMESTTSGKPKSVDLFIGVVFHEILHTYVTECMGGRESRMRAVHASEDSKTLAHLHLYSVLIPAFKSLGWDEQLAPLKESDTFHDSPKGEYRRAWEIIEQEGPEPFLEELRS